MKKARPINLDLGSLKYPPMAIVSILHRISGIVLFLLMPVMLWYLSRSLHSEMSFNELQENFNDPLPKLFVLGFASAWAFHVLAGIRHILMDFGYGEGLVAGRSSAVIVLVLAVISIILLGLRIW